MNDSMEKLLTVEEVMALLRISRPTLYRLLKSKALGPVRIGKRTLFDPADIRAFIEGSKREAAPKTSQQPEEPKRPRAKRKAPRPEETKTAPEVQEGIVSEPTLPKRPPAKPEEPPEVTDRPEKQKQVKESKPDDSDRQGRLL